MTLQQKDYSPGWMDVLINSAIGPTNNQTTLGGRTAYTLLVLDMDTCGMTWIALHVTSTLVKKIKMRSILIGPSSFFLPSFSSFTTAISLYFKSKKGHIVQSTDSRHSWLLLNPLYIPSWSLMYYSEDSVSYSIWDCITAFLKTYNNA